MGGDCSRPFLKFTLDGFVIRLTSWTYDGKESGEYQYNESGDVIKSGNWTYVYSADKRTKIGSAKSTSITETYDEQGYLAQRSENSYAGSATSTFTYEFNSDGTVSTRIEKRTEHNGLISHERDCVVSYEYGDNGLVSKETETETSAYNLREGKGPNSITVRKYYYDDNGQMLSRKDTITSYNLTTGEAHESNHRFEYTSGWVYAPNAESKRAGAGAIPPRAVSVNRLYPNDTLKRAAFPCHTSLFLSFEIFQK